MQYFEENKISVFTTQTTMKVGEKFSISLRISNDFGFVNEARIIMNQQGGTNEKNFKLEYQLTKENISYFNASIALENTGIHYFCFKLIINGQVKWIKYNPETEKPCMTENDFPYWQITVYENDFKVPDWAKGKIMYHIMVDRFFKSKNYVPKEIKGRITNKWGEMPIWYPDEKGEYNNNDFFMGNLKGIEEKIPYLKELGVEILYLSPICQSQSNHRYDTADYENVDPYLGTNSDLQSLCDSAHKSGIKVIIDAVFNHTGNDSKYFNEYGNYDTIGAFQGTKSPYYNWYKRKQNGEIEYWWGFKNLPVCNGNNPEWQRYIYGENGVIDKWFNLGIDGLRLDVADELTDDFIENIRIAVKRNKPDGFILGEVWENAVTKEGYGKQRTYLLGKGLDSVMNYPFTNAILKYVRFGNYKYLSKTIKEILTQYPDEAKYALMNSLSTHDITRAITTLSGNGIQDNNYNLIWNIPYDRQWQFRNDKLDEQTYNQGKQLLKIATVIQYFLPGNPCIFYGDEAGLYGYKDPFNRKCFPWNIIDDELHEFFSNLGKIRKKYEFLKNADMKIIELQESIFAFERFDEENGILVVVNRSEEDININLTQDYEMGEIIFKMNSSKNIISKYGILIIAL